MVQRKGRQRTIGLRGRTWWALRKNKQMTMLDIKFSVCTGSEKNPDTNLRIWLNHLIAVGIVERHRIDDGKLNSNGSYCYRLITDLGPKAPVVQIKIGQVLDPNSGNCYPLPSHGEVNND